MTLLGRSRYGRLSTRGPLAVALSLALGWIVPYHNAWAKAVTEKVDAAPEHHAAIGINPAGVFMRALTVSADAALCERLALGLFLHGTFGNPRGGRTNNNGQQIESTTRMVGVQAWYKLTGKIYDDGWYLSPFVQYTQSTVRDANADFSTYIRGPGAGATVGYGFYGQGGLYVLIGGGVQYQALTMGDSDYKDSAGNAQSLPTRRQKGLLPTGDLVVGLAF